MIYYDTNVLIASGYRIDPDTGDKIMGDLTNVPARVLNSFKEIRTFKGERTISAIKIYMSEKAQDALMAQKSKVIIGEKDYTILNFEEKKHLNGTVSHYIVYV